MAPVIEQVVVLVEGRWFDPSLLQSAVRGGDIEPQIAPNSR